MIKKNLIGNGFVMKQKMKNLSWGKNDLKYNIYSNYDFYSPAGSTAAMAVALCPFLFV
jgi:hypothetical protein